MKEHRVPTIPKGFTKYIYSDPGVENLDILVLMFIHLALNNSNKVVESLKKIYAIFSLNSIINEKLQDKHYNVT